MASAETAISVRCSFCGKASTEVNKMIAGPGVHICNVCVGLCNTILEQETTTPRNPQLPVWESMTDEQILDHIPRIAAVEAQVEQNLREWVGELRDREVTWERIGTALGITRQSAWERFSAER
jgi:hypothetical protein